LAPTVVEPLPVDCCVQCACSTGPCPA